MRSANRGYNPETVAKLQRCIDTVLNTLCDEGASPGISEPEREATRTKVASAVLEASGLGLREEGEIVAFALRAFPAFRESIFARR